MILRLANTYFQPYLLQLLIVQKPLHILHTWWEFDLMVGATNPKPEQYDQVAVNNLNNQTVTWNATKKNGEYLLSENHAYLYR